MKAFYAMQTGILFRLRVHFGSLKTGKCREVLSFIQLKMSLSASIKERNAEKNRLTVHSAIDVICAVVHKYTSQVVLKLD